MGWRVLHGVNTVAMCEVWVVHLVAFGMGADVGNLIEVRSWKGNTMGRRWEVLGASGDGLSGQGRRNGEIQGVQEAMTMCDVRVVRVGAPGGVRHGR